jgi:uncharacterized phage protein (TIGR02218 family)
MKTVPGALQTLLDSGTVTLATLWKVTRVDATIIGFTDHDANLVISAVTYQSATGYTRTAIQSTADMSVDNLELDGLIVASAVNEDDLRSNKYQGAEVRVSVCDYANLATTPVLLRRGWIGKIIIRDGIYVAELRGLSDRLQQTIGRVYGRECDADFGDARCGIDATAGAHNATGTVGTVTSDSEFYDAARTETKWTAGKLTWTSGDNNGVSIEVKKADGAGNIELWQAMPKAITIGDTYAIRAGCQKRRVEDCITLYNNAVNFRGFDTIPGTDYLTNYPDAQ